MTAGRSPNPGQRIRIRHPLRQLINRLGIAMPEVAQTLDLTPEENYALVVNGRFPARADEDELREDLSSLLQSRGALRADLQAVFAQTAAAPSVAGQAPDAQDELNASPAEAPHQEIDVLIAKQVLTPAASRHFKLTRNPFDGPVVHEGDMFVSDEIAYVRELVWQCAVGASFMALIGESGAGKTTILADLEERLRGGPRGVVLFKPSIVGMEESDRAGHMLKSADLLHCIISTLDSSARVPTSLQARTMLATRLLAASVRAGNSHLLAVEEAHRMPEPTLRHLKRLHELREGRRPLLGILLLAQPELQRRLNDGLRTGKLREVAQRCEVSVLPPLGEDLQGYLECRVKACGRPLDSIVEPGAVASIAQRLTAKVGQDIVPMSYPLAVNNLVTRAMNMAARVGAPTVTKDVALAI